MKKSKSFVYRSTYDKPFYYWLLKESKDIVLIDMIKIVTKVFNVNYLLKSAYFKLLRFGDRKYDILVQKYDEDITGKLNYKITITINKDE